jgi:acyl homoserine lactone synthase
MIEVIEAPVYQRYTQLLDDMFRLRADVFQRKLNWDVEVHDGRELDVFDAASPTYILSVEESTRRLRGAVRLLPTTGPNMLRDVFSQLLPHGEKIESPMIWESSRFCVDPNIPQTSTNGINPVTAELLCGLIDVGLGSGLAKIVSVFDARMARIFRAAGCAPTFVGKPMRFGGVMTYAGLFNISLEMRNCISKKVSKRHSTATFEQPAVIAA